MKLIKLISVAFLIVFFAKNSNSQVNTLELKSSSKHALGFAAGGTSGVGLAYKYSPNRLSFQFVFAPIKSQYNYAYSAGLSIFYKLVDNKKIDFFLYQGNHLFVEGSTHPVYNHKDEYLSHGLGFGFEYSFTEKFTASLMAGYGGFNNFKFISMTGEMNIFYNF